MPRKALIQHRLPADSQNKPHRPSHFQMRLCPHDGIHPGQGAAQDRMLNDRHVMLVQSGAIELRAVAEMISALGYRVTPIEESGRALLYFGRKPCQLVISELDLPQFNGYQLARCIRRYSPRTRILLMTACCQAEVADYMKDRVVDGWLFKPFGIDELKYKLESKKDSKQLEPKSFF
ncbi:MAG: response regulator [Desulfobacteraceae bacterium]